MAARLLGGAGRAALLPNVRRRATNSWAAVRDTFFSTKEVFENHRVVFTVGTSIASVLTAWAGYSIRHMQQSKIDKRLHSIEQSLKDTHRNDHDEIKKIVTSNNISASACIATALTTTVVGSASKDTWLWQTGGSRKSLRTQVMMIELFCTLASVVVWY